MGTIKIPAAEVLKKIYGETEESSARYTNPYRSSRHNLKP